MDADRWDKALTISHSASSESGKQSRKSSTNRSRGKSKIESVDERQVIPNRYQYDLEQAKAMRSRSSMDNTKSGSEQDIQLGLKGLDQASSYRHQGDLVNALRLYELALELLIVHLRKNSEARSPVGSIYGSYRLQDVEARVRRGLSDAEEIKACLNSSSYQHPSETTKKALKENGRQSNNDRVDEQIARFIQEALSKTSRNASVQPAAKPNVAAGNRRQVQETPASSALSHPHINNELYQMVLTDMLIEPENLPRTSWDDIAGLEEVKQSLQEAAILPLLRPDLFTGLRKPQNILLWGPPGTGKTLLARTVARESHSSFFACSASTLVSKWMGEAEKLVKTLFEVARERTLTTRSSSIIFIDEVDALLSSRKSEGEHEASRRLKTEIMVQMEGIVNDSSQDNSPHHVLVLACTNCPWDLDSAVLRRFPRRIFVPLPDAAARSSLLKKLLTKAGKHNLTAKQIGSLVGKLDGFSCSDITAIASEASFGPIRSLGSGNLQEAVRGARARDIRPLSLQDFEKALASATKSVTAEQLHRYKAWRKEQGSA